MASRTDTPQNTCKKTLPCFLWVSHTKHDFAQHLNFCGFFTGFFTFNMKMFLQFVLGRQNQKKQEGTKKNATTKGKGNELSRKKQDGGLSNKKQHNRRKKKKKKKSSFTNWLLFYPTTLDTSAILELTPSSHTTI